LLSLKKQELKLHTWHANGLNPPQCLSSSLAVPLCLEISILTQFSVLLTLFGCESAQNLESILVAELLHHINAVFELLNPDVQYRELYFQEYPFSETHNVSIYK
jgi:hypothetical protein